MPVGTSSTYSAAGSRGYIRVGYAGVLSRYSTGSISLGGGSPASHNQQRTWWIADDFDYSSNPASNSFFMLPCDSATFNLGEDLYRNANDAVPGAMRMKAGRCGAYTFKISFPLIISSNSEINSAYSVVSNVVQKANYMLALNTSLQTRNYSSIVENFTISADGYNGANPVSCQLTTRGLSQAPDMNDISSIRSIIMTNTRRDKEKRYSGNLASQINYDAPKNIGAAGTYGGRFVNIKDCIISLNNKELQQIVSMELSIQNQLDLASTAKSEVYSVHTPTIRSADRVFLTERVVKGSFKILSSYISSVGDLSALDSSNADAKAFSLASRTKHQWASPLYMNFGAKMIFNMPAVYWQPRIEELSTGSPLITINFIARSNIFGINEFMSGL